MPRTWVLTVCSPMVSSWFFQPFFADGDQTPFTPELFVLRGVGFAAWTLAAFAIGALAGLLIRRVVPAIAATLAAYAGLAWQPAWSCASTTRCRWSPATRTCPVRRGS